MERESSTLFDTIYKTFKYSKKEMVCLEELLKQRDEASTLFYKNYFDLESRREKCMASGEYLKILEKEPKVADIPKDELVKNKAVAKALLFPEVSSIYKGSHQVEGDAEVLRLPK